MKYFNFSIYKLIYCLKILRLFNCFINNNDDDSPNLNLLFKFY